MQLTYTDKEFIWSLKMLYSGCPCSGPITDLNKVFALAQEQGLTVVAFETVERLSTSKHSNPSILKDPSPVMVQTNEVSLECIDQETQVLAGIR